MLGVGASFMGWVAGVDGCRGGWAVALREGETGRIEVRRVAWVEEILGWAEAPAVVGIDIPIGLLHEAVPSGRACDRLARVLLGDPRGRSVFSAPVRAVLEATTYEEAVACNRASSSHAIGISRQCWGIVPKIAEVDRWMTPELQDRMIEVHPEVSFHAMNDERPLIAAKKTQRGIEERVALLERAWGGDIRSVVDARRDPAIATDDLLDALAACWTAERVAKGEAVRLPATAVRDARGLRMEIVR
jgi:predicted RNase H-like nuclease